MDSVAADIYQAVLDHMPVGVILLDRSGIITYANKSAAVISGYSTDELIKGELFHNPDNSAIKELFERACSQDTAGKDHIVQIVQKNGDIVWVLISWQAIPTTDTSNNLVQLDLVDITSRKLADTALRESEEKYRCIVESSHDTIMINSPDARLTYISPSCFDLIEYDPDELMGKIPMIVHPDDRILAGELFVKAISGFSGADAEYRIITKTGNIKWVSHSWSPVFSDYKLLMVVSVLRDITEAKNTEDALRKSEKLYRELIESQFDLIVRVNAENQFTFVNEAYCNMFGKTSEELLGSSFAPLVHEDDLPRTLAAMEMLKTPPYRCYVEQRALTVNGWRWLAWEDGAIIDENGCIVEIQAVGRDITTSKMEHEALVQSEARLRAFVANIPGAVYRTKPTPDYRMVFFNDTIEAITGYPAQDFVDNQVRTMASIIYPEDKLVVYEHGQEWIRNRGTFLLEYRVVHADGTPRWVQDRGQAVISEDGELLSLDGILFDITARKSAEEELRSAYNIQREFLNNVTHEVRTPLTAVQGYVQMILEGTMGPINNEQASLLKKVLSNSDHLLSIVTGILEIARTKSGKLQLQPKICNVNQLIDTAISTIMPQATRKGLYVTFEKPVKQQFGIYDAQKLIIILTNLLTNAAKFTENGGITVRLSGNCQGVEIIVSDTGLGIDPDKMDSIYEEFTQLDYPKKHKPVGFGIGLSIVETMVETIHGELTISSALDIGTAFTLFAPKLEG